MKSPSRYVLYTRVSTDGQEDNFSHDSQLAALQDHVTKQGGYAVEIIRETASGGSLLGRPGIQKALHMLEGNQADVLACYDFSRYSRDVEHQQQIARRVRSAGKRLEFATQEFQTGEDGQLTPESDLMFGVSGSFAAYHKAKIRADCMRGAKAAALKGNQTRRKAPFGYHIATKADVLAGRYQSDDLGKYFVIESEAAAIREIFARRAKGESLVEISRALVKQGIRTRRGIPFTMAGLSKIIANTVYIGEATFGRTRRVGDEARLDQGLRTDFRIAYRGADDVIKIAAPAIVERELFDVCAKLKGLPRNAKVSALGDRRARFLLSGVLKCPRCNGPMIGKHATRSASGKITGRRKRGDIAKPRERVVQRFYICRYADMAQSPIPCLGRQYPAAQFDDKILEFLRKAAQDMRLVQATLKDQSQKRNNDEIQVEALQEQITEVEKRERQLIETSLSLGELGGDTLAKMLYETGESKRQLSERLNQVLSSTSRELTPKRSEQIRSALESVKGLLEDPEALTPLSTTLQRLHSFLRLNFERIEFEEPEPFSVVNLKVTLKT